MHIIVLLLCNWLFISNAYFAFSSLCYIVWYSKLATLTFVLQQIRSVSFFYRYGEVCKPGYSFSGTSAGAAGHFTQVVWKGTVSLGIGMATGKSETGLFCSYVVARYRPPGDFIGEYKENVPKGEFNKEICAKLDEMVKNITKGISY